jgi:ring-1,2-phenylacetyl-CoA epoxidase subunit PaaC
MERDPFVDYCSRLGDDRLVLGHRLSEWCGHAPILEEELALANVALDLIGQAQVLLGIAAEVEGRGRSADQLAFFREAIDYRNVVLVEQPNGDFAHTVVRQFLFDALDVALTTALRSSADSRVAAWAGKAEAESAYHLRHSRGWVIRLGDGTEESRRRTEAAVAALWRFTPELFAADDGERRLVECGIAADTSRLREPWLHEVGATFAAAGLSPPDDGSAAAAPRRGPHSEHLGHLLAEMQIVARSFPGAEW